MIEAEILMKKELRIKISGEEAEYFIGLLNRIEGGFHIEENTEDTAFAKRLKLELGLK